LEVIREVKLPIRSLEETFLGSYLTNWDFFKKVKKKVLNPRERNWEGPNLFLCVGIGPKGHGLGDNRKGLHWGGKFSG